MSEDGHVEDRQSGEGGGSEDGAEEGLQWQPHEYLLEELITPETVVRPHIDQSSLLCRTGCGFYGYPAWQGHCSKCYKELQNRSSSRRSVHISRPVFDPANIRNKVTRSVSDVAVLPGKASSLFNKKIDKLVEEKRRHHLQKHKNNNLVKAIFRKSSSSKSKDKDRIGGIDSATAASQEFDSFLKTLSKEGGGAIRKQVSVCVDKLRRTLQSQTLEQTADLLQDLYTCLHSMVTTHSAFTGLSEEDVARVVSLSERYVCTRLHSLLRGATNAFCEEQDLSTQDRIRRLNWISADMLESKLDDEDISMAAGVDAIIGALLEVDGAAVPSDKLAVLVSVSHQILQALSSLSAAPAAADDFLPALIFCLIRANPPMLHSNIAYITNFAPRFQLHSGETGYYFTNLCCAVAFIEKVCGASLGLTEEEFSRHMKGRGLTRHSKPPPSVTALTNSLHRYSRAAHSISAINASYTDMIAQITQLKQAVTDKVTEVLQDNPCVQREPYTSVGILNLLDTKQHHLLPQLSQDDSSPVSPPPLSADEIPARTSTNLPEVEEAFNLYYSLDDLLSQDLDKSPKDAQSTKPANSFVTLGAESDVTALHVSSVASLLDEPVPDRTLSLLDQSPASVFDSSVDAASLVEHGPSSMLDHGPSSMLDHGPSSMLDQGSSSMLDHGSSSMLDHGSSSMLDQGPSSMLDQGPSSMLDQGPSSMLDQGPSSMLDQGSFSYLDHKSPSLIDRCSASLLEQNHTSLLDDSSTSLRNLSPISLHDQTPISLLDEPVILQGSSSLLPLPEYSGFREQSNLIPSIPCEMGPTSLNDSAKNFASMGYPDSMSLKTAKFSDLLYESDSLAFSRRPTLNNSVLNPDRKEGNTSTEDAVVLDLISGTEAQVIGDSANSEELFAVWPDSISAAEGNASVSMLCMGSSAAAGSGGHTMGDDDRPEDTARADAAPCGGGAAAAAAYQQ